MGNLFDCELCEDEVEGTVVSPPGGRIHSKAQEEYRTNTKELSHLLLEAAAAGDEDTCRELLAQGAPLGAADEQRSTPLHLASAVGLVGLLELFLQHGAFLNAQSEDGATPLFLAAREGHLQVSCSIPTLKTFSRILIIVFFFFFFFFLSLFFF